MAVNIPQLNGLCDKNIEGTINARVLADFKDQMTALQKDNDENRFIGNHFKILFNANHVLSLSQTIQYRFGNQNYSDEKGYTYDLINGKVLELKDIFIEKLNYVSLLNHEVIEEIIKSSKEEEFLKEPFSSIQVNQNFCYSKDKLRLYFKKNTAGFAIDKMISINMEKIDDYTTALEGIPCQKVNVYENPEEMQKNNNILIVNKQKNITNGKYLVRVSYPEFVRYNNNHTISSLNGLIAKRIKALEKIKIIEKDDLSSLEEGEVLANNKIFVDYSTRYNINGRIGIIEKIKGAGFPKNEVGFVLFFDLFHVRELDGRVLFKKIVKNQKEYEQIFTEKVNKVLQEDFLRFEKSFNNPSQPNFKITLDMVFTKALVYFEEKKVNLHFNKASLQIFSGGIDVGLDLKQLIGKNMEEFMTEQ